jgi:putative lipoprotein
MKHPQHALGFVVLLTMAASCAKAPEQVAGPTVVAAPAPDGPSAAGLALADTEWALETVAGEPIDSERAITVAFDAGGRVTGNAGCNRFFGSYVVEGEKIAVGHLGATQMACPPEQMAQEERFLDALGRVDRASLREGLLVLRFGKEAQELVLVGAEPSQVVTGNVVYRERIALPPDAALTVRLLDASRTDAPAVALAEQRITPTGQVPIPFEIPYDPAGIDDEMSCVLEARIEAGGTLLFVSTRAIPVITRGSPSKDLEIVVERAGG